MSFRIARFTLLLGVAAGLVAIARGEPVLTTSMLAPTATQRAKSTIELSVVVLNRGDAPASVALPASFEGQLQVPDQVWPVQVQLVDGAREAEIAAGAFAAFPCMLEIPDTTRGRAILAVHEPWAMRAVIDVSGPVMPAPAGWPFASATPADATPAIARMPRAFTRHFGLHEPIYFLYGPDAPAAKFQFSFRYGLADSGTGAGDTPLHGLYFGYTQRSLWDIESESSPFYDTSYMPELFFEQLAPSRASTGHGITWLGWQAGVRHESNGRSGPDSRSLNTAGLRGGLAVGALDGWRLIVIPRLFTYLQTSEENADIEDYRGYGELRLVFGRNAGPNLAANLQVGKDWDHPTLQLDFTHPLQVPYVNFDTYLHFQYFDGYGESLLNYDLKGSTWRLGVSLVR
ncbi:MAG: phospholipase A [Opitutaceae bacterium]|nr:phospholipase A [Opitutaceae bacterium]